MQASNTFKKSFLKLMIKGLRLHGVHSKTMCVQERKRAIKLSADAAMAVSRGRTRWSEALIKGLSKGQGKREMAGNHEEERRCKWKIPTSKKILRRSLRPRPKTKNVEASVVARRMAKKRTQVLKRIIPGGESLDGLSLLGETLDYVIHLRAQVNLMKCLAKALGASNPKSQKGMHCKKEKDQELACNDDCGEMGSGSRVLQPREGVIDSNKFGSEKA